MHDPETQPTRWPAQTPTGATGAEQPAHAVHMHLAPGTLISHYRIESVLDEGGMGTVYLARQEKPDRQVALKLIRPGYVTPNLLKRFEMEVEVLGRLLHTGIAQIYEAGTADLGAGAQPFFAMELVRGMPLTRYAEEKALGTRGRLELLAAICGAVQHAHQKGVIHRDLKPANILVDEHGQPKILDFGVARAVDSDLLSVTMQTDVGALVGTVPYMSPEQVTGDSAQLDTRSDVYALGVVAFELLTGRLPYVLDKKLIHEALRIIREEEPTRLSSIDRTLRGDVETIVAHALDKDKTRRYQAASDLAADIRRYLADEPITARPSSTWYQVRKFSKRNKTLVGGVVASFVTLAAGVIVSQYAFHQARQRSAELQQVADFQGNMLAGIWPADVGVKLFYDIARRYDAALVKAKVPDEERAAKVRSLVADLARVNATDTAAAMIDRTILKPAVFVIDANFKRQPAVDAKLRQVLAARYRDLGLFDASEPLQLNALETRRRILGPDDPDTLISVANLGMLLREEGRLADAEPLARRAADGCRRVLGPDHPNTIIATHNLAALLWSMGRLDEAQPLMDESLRRSRVVLGATHPMTLAAIGDLSALLDARGDLKEAEPLAREAMDLERRTLGEDHPRTLLSINNVACLLSKTGRTKDAEPLFREAFEKSRRLRGEDHPDTIASQASLGNVLRDLGRLDDAETCLSDALEKARRTLGETHTITELARANLSLVVQAKGDRARAESLARESLDRPPTGPDDPEALDRLVNLGGLLWSQGKLSEAEPLMKEALEKSRSKLGPHHSVTLTAVNNVGCLLQSQGKSSEAESMFAHGVRDCRVAFPDGHPLTALLLHHHAEALRVLGRMADAIPDAREAVNLYEAHPDWSLPEATHALFVLEALLEASGQSEEALAFAFKRLALVRLIHGPGTAALSADLAGFGLVLLHRHTDQAARQAEPLLREALEIRERLMPGDWKVANTRSLLGEALLMQAASDSASTQDARSARLREAESLLLSGFAGLQDNPAVPTPAQANGADRTREALERIVHLYEAWNTLEPHGGYDAKIAEWKARLAARPEAPGTK